MQKICIVIPCYNEENRLPVQDFLSFFTENPFYNFCFVNDGSTDSTLNVLKELKKHNTNTISIINLKKNKGKAEAVRQGVLEALKWKKFEYIGYLDADLATPLSELNYLLNFNLNDEYHYSIIAGSRVKRLGAQIERKASRHYLGRIFSTFASIILNLPVYDTQCGAKILSAKIASEIFAEKFISRWLFDVEIFARFITLFGSDSAKSQIIEVPLNQWLEKGGSKIKLSYFFKVPFELLKIHNKYKIRRN